MDILDRLRGAATGTHGLDEADEKALMEDAAAEIVTLRNKLQVAKTWVAATDRRMSRGQREHMDRDYRRPEF